MKIKLQTLVLILGCMLVLCGCSCQHEWTAATCTTPKTCTKCGMTEGSTLPHQWRDADCNTAKTCVSCNTTSGSPLGHEWQAATCSAPSTCTVCGTTRGKPSEHRWHSAVSTQKGTYGRMCLDCLIYESDIPDPIPLPYCDILKDSNQEGSTTDVCSGNWRDTSGNIHKNAIRFWVIDREGWDEKEYIEYELGAHYETLQGTVCAGADSEEDARMKLDFYLDGDLVHTVENITYSSEAYFSIDVRDAKKIRIVCTTDKDAFGYCILSATLG